MDAVDEIKQRLDIAAVIAEYVQLKKAGASYKARCPFHNEKTPSFHVSPDRQIWHCFGCNAGGDIFGFVQKIEGLDFPDALKLLAKKAGVELPRFDAKTAGLKARLHEICDLAARHWQNNLLSDEGKAAMNYLISRGIGRKTIDEFKLGYADDNWDNLMKFLLNKGFTEAEILQAGLIIKKEKGIGCYDRFRDRIIFPIADVHGSIIGFGGRVLKAEETAKYINTPEGQLYHKGQILYGLDKAKQAIRGVGYVIVVEGNMDVVSCHQAGYKNVVACSGTALTLDQIRLIKRYANNVALCLDQDEAGQAAASRSIELLFAEEMNTKIVQVTVGKDPDECIRKDVGAWAASLKAAKEVMQFYFDRYLTSLALSNIQGKKQAAKSVLAEIAKIKNKIEQDHWIKKLGEILRVDEKLLWASLPNAIRPGISSVRLKKEQPAPLKVAKSKEENCWERIFSILLNYPRFISFAIEYLSVEMSPTPDWQYFYKSLIILYNNKKELSASDVDGWLQNEKMPFSLNYLQGVILNLNRIYDGFSPEQLSQELMSLIDSYKISWLERKIKEATRKLADAEKEKKNDESNQFAKELQCLSTELLKLK